MGHVMEKMAYDEKGVEICKAIEDRKYFGFIFKGFTEKERDQILRAFAGMGIKTIGHFLHPDGKHEYEIKL